MTKILENMFSVKNEGKHKVIFLLGIKLKFKRNFKEAELIKQSWEEAEEINLANFINSEIYKNLNFNSICIDCGANVGKITEAFHNKGATVYSFEPNQQCFEELVQKFKSNDKIHLFQKGVLDKNSTMKLYKSIYDKDDSLFFSQSSSLYSSKKNINTNEYYEVECIDLIEFIKGLNVDIDVLKIDVEGAEFQILEKLISEKLYERIKHILVETHDDSIPEIKEIATRVRKIIKDFNISNIHLDWV